MSDDQIGVGTVEVNGADFGVHKWNVDDSQGTMEDKTDTGSDTKDGVPCAERILTKHDVSFGFDYTFDADEHPYTDYDFYKGAELVNVKLHVGNTGDYWLFPLAKCDGNKVDSVVGSRVTGSVAGLSHGTFSRPGE